MCPIKSSLLTAAFLGLSQAALAQYQIERCGSWGDSLDAAAAEGRREWTKRCFPTFKPLVNGQQWFVDAKNPADRRRAYPIFGISQESGEATNPQKWFAPTKVDAACDTPANYTIVMFCGAGCYTADQAILLTDGYTNIETAKLINPQTVVTLSANSTLQSLKFKSTNVDYFMADNKAFEQAVVEFKMKSGGKIKVTLNHPLVVADGSIRTAESLAVGDALITADGLEDPIQQVIRSNYFGKVYNVAVDSTDLQENIVVAQGYLNGSVMYQNEGARYLNQVLLRTNAIPDSLIR